MELWYFQVTVRVATISRRQQDHTGIDLERILEIVKSSYLVLPMKKTPEMDSDFLKVTQLVSGRPRVYS